MTRYTAPTKQEQEAKAIWQLAKELGVTCGTLNSNPVNKIMKMEERDKKEAQRVGSSRSYQ